MYDDDFMASRWRDYNEKEWEVWTKDPELCRLATTESKEMILASLPGEWVERGEVTRVDGADRVKEEACIPTLTKLGQKYHHLRMHVTEKWSV